jgi:hypothetical protein
MSNYVKSTNFTTKDTLNSGDPNKIVKGTELDTEFIAIASAIQSKADLASPAFTGVPTAPTAAEFTNTAQVATSAFVQQELTRTTNALGTMSTQNKGAVDIEGGTIDATPIGASTASTVRGTTVTATTGFVGNLTGSVTGNASTATSATSAGFANNGVKAWAIYNTSSGLVRSYNMASVSAGSLSWTFNFTSAMSNSNYGIAMTHSPTSAADIFNRPLNVDSWNSSSVTVTSPGAGTPAYIWITVFDY